MTLATFMLLLQVTQPALPEVVTRTRADCSRGVDFHAIVAPETVYVGQQATYQLGVFIGQETRSRLRRNPEFLPPESRSMLSYDLPDRQSVQTVTIGGVPCETHIFRRALFPLTPGRYAIPPARLTYALPQSPSFFSREESHALTSEATTLVAVDPPSVGRPADWLGAVGSWRAISRIGAGRGRAGDPLVLTLRIEGQGNVTLLPRPAVSIGWATVVPADERVLLDSTPTVLRGSKEFDWLVTPAAAGAQRVPALRFVYFNPASRRYEVTLSEPLTVRVAPGDVVALDRSVEAQSRATPLPLRGALGDETPLPLGDLDWVRAMLLVAPLAALGAWMIRRPRRAPRAVTPLDRLQALRRAAAGEGEAAQVRRALLDGLRQRTGLDPALLAQAGAWTRALRRSGVTSDTAQDVEVLIDRLDRSAFGGVEAPAPELAERAAELLARVQREATGSSGAPAGINGVAGVTAFFICAITLAAAAVLAGDVARAREPFAQGVTAYAGADYVRASRLFEDAARAAPRAAAAWANEGTAAWAAGDSAGAAVGWQHALRLDPTAPELRGRLQQIRAPQDVGPARVIGMPARLPSAIAILLWIGGWALATRQCWRRRPARPVILVTLVIAGAACVGARLFEDQLEGRRLVVVTDPAALRSLPALGAEGGAMPLVGEVAVVLHRSGVWTRVSLDGGRVGWIATERVAPLGRD